jgi:hypothetical protein
MRRTVLLLVLALGMLDARRAAGGTAEGPNETIGKITINYQFEIGIALGDFVPLSIFDLDTQRFGGSFRFGQFQAFHLNLGFPF